MSHAISVDFIKCHGVGNDFIVVDETRAEVVPEQAKAAFARLSGRRGGGIGCDGIIFVSSFDQTHPRMRFFNPDGSTAEMSGNGIRCASRVCFEGSYKGISPLIFETAGGRFQTENFISPEFGIPFVRVQAGHVETNPSKVLKNQSQEPFISKPFQVLGREMTGTILSIGNPHLIVTVASLKSLDLNALGEALEHHEMFANRANISFVQVIQPDKILVQTHERGAGLTLSCGTGMTASVVAQALEGRVHNHEPVEIHTAGGIAWVTPHKDEHTLSAQLTGNATFVYRARVRILIQGAEVQFLPDTEVEPIYVYREETLTYARFAQRSLFDISILKDTPIYPQALALVNG